MATSRRVSRVAELIKREVSQMLLYGIKDDRVGTGMVSVTDVDVSGDLQHAKIFVSIYGTGSQGRDYGGLKVGDRAFVVNWGSRFACAVHQKLCLEDRSIERGTRVLSLLNQLNHALD